MALRKQSKIRKRNSPYYQRREHYEPWYDQFQDFNLNAPNFFNWLAKYNWRINLHQKLINRLLDRDVQVEDTKSIDLTLTGDWHDDMACPPNYDDELVIKADVIISDETELRNLVNVKPYTFTVENGSKIKDTGLWSPDYFSLLSSIDIEIGVIQGDINDINNEITNIHNEITNIKNDITNIYNELGELGNQIINNSYNGLYTLYTTSVTKVREDSGGFFIPHFNADKKDGNLPDTVFSQTNSYAGIIVTNTTEVPLLVNSSFNCSMETDMNLSACYISIVRDGEAIGQAPFIAPSTYDQQVLAEPFILQPNQSTTLSYYFRIGGANEAFKPIFGGTGDILAVLNPDDDDPATQRNYFNVTAQSITTHGG